jgi:hypothetical protein
VQLEATSGVLGEGWIMKKPSLPIFAIAGIVSALVYTLPTWASPTPAVHSSSTKQLSFNSVLEEFAGDRRPRHRTSGGSRGPCLNQLIALVPGSEQIEMHEGTCSARSVSLVSLTVDASPTFWFYIPQPPQSGTPAEFVLLDENQQPILIEQVTLPAVAGIVAIPLSQPLAANRSYAWGFSISVNPRSSSQNPRVEGIVRRIAPTAGLSTQLQTLTSPQEQAAIYAEHGIWHDALTMLAEQRLAAPNNTTLITDWSHFLDSAGLGAIATAPFLDCCTSTSAPIK